MKTLLIAFLAGYCCLWATAGSHAAPVTFRFEGTVTDISILPEASIGLPLPAEISMAVYGQVIFVPFSFGQDGTALDIQFTIADETISIANTPLVTRDNELLPANADFPGGVVDSIYLGCSTTSSCTTAETTLTNVQVEQVRLELVSTNPSTATSGESLANPVFWNKFTFDPEGGVGFAASRRFFLELNSVGSTSGTVLIRGSIGPMLVVPEPLSIVLVTNMGLLFFRRDRSRLVMVHSKWISWLYNQGEMDVQKKS